MLGIISKLIFGSKQMKIPVLGLPGAGKTCFIASMAYLMTEYVGSNFNEHWAEIVEGQEYLQRIIPMILRGTYVPTPSPRRVVIRVKRIAIDGEEYISDFLLYMPDPSGKEFEMAMRDLAENRYSENVRKFYEVYSDSDGLIVIVDLVREKSKKEFKSNKEKYVIEALEEQVAPLATGIINILETSNLEGKPVFFVFTKADIHEMSIEEISKYFDRYMAILLRHLEDKGVIIKKYAVASLGWNPQEIRHMPQGFLDLIFDLGRIFGRRVK